VNVSEAWRTDKVGSQRQLQDFGRTQITACLVGGSDEFSQGQSLGFDPAGKFFGFGFHKDKRVGTGFNSENFCEVSLLKEKTGQPLDRSDHPVRGGMNELTEG